MVANDKEKIHELFLQGKTYKEIAVLINSNAAAVALRIKRYRKRDPIAWPRLKNYIEPLSIKVQVFKCSSCHVVFAIEKETDFANDVTCPFCWEREHLQTIGVSHVNVREVKN